MLFCIKVSINDFELVKRVRSEKSYCCGGLKLFQERAVQH